MTKKKSLLLIAIIAIITGICATCCLILKPKEIKAGESDIAALNAVGFNPLVVKDVPESEQTSNLPFITPEEMGLNKAKYERVKTNGEILSSGKPEYTIIKNARTGEPNSKIENFYIAFGNLPKLNEDKITFSRPLETDISYLTSFNINIFYNGKEIANVNPTKSINYKAPETTTTANDDVTTPNTVVYWYQYFDMSELTLKEGNTRIDNPQGTLTFKVTYSTIKNGITNNGSSSDFSKNVDISLLTQASYISNFPFIRNANKNSSDNLFLTNEAISENPYLKTPSKTLKYYYNYSNKNDFANKNRELPNIYFNSELYSIQIEHNVNGIINTYYTDWKVNSEQDKQLFIKHNGQSQTEYYNETTQMYPIRLVKPTNSDDKYYSIEFEDFGEYKIEIFYFIKKVTNLTKIEYVRAVGPNCVSTSTEPITFFKQYKNNTIAHNDVNDILSQITQDTTNYNNNEFILSNVGLESYFRKEETSITSTKRVDNLLQHAKGNPTETIWKMANASSNGVLNDILFESPNINDPCNPLTDKHIADPNLTDVAGTSIKNDIANYIRTKYNNKNNIPVLNQGPISFNMFYDTLTIKPHLSGYLKFPNSKSFNDNKITPQPFTKNTTFSENGIYALLITYKYDLLDFQQLFMFEIKRVAPELKIYKTDSATYPEVNLSENLFTSKYTNQNIYLSYPVPNYFEAPIKAKYTYNSFEGAAGFDTEFIESNNYERESTIFSKNGYYAVKLEYGEGLNSTIHTFIIDKMPIENVEYTPVSAVIDKLSRNIIGYNKVNEKSKANKNITTDPFTIEYDEKISGANINVKYKQIPFKKDTTLSISPITRFSSNINSAYSPLSEIKTENYALTTQYTIETNNKIYAFNNFNINLNRNGTLNESSVFVQDISSLFLFELEDEAGNKTSFFVIYDRLEPNIIFKQDGEIVKNNPYNAFNRETQVVWGLYKAISYSSAIISDPTLKKFNETSNFVENLVTPETSDQNADLRISKPYLLIANKNVDFSYIDAKTNKPVTFQKKVNTSEPATAYTTITALKSLANPTENQLKIEAFYFNGEHDYVATITPDSYFDNRAVNVLNNNPSGTYNFSLNLDRNKCAIHGEFRGLIDGGKSGAGPALTAGLPTNTKSLRISFIPNIEEGQAVEETTNAIKSLEYFYYPVDLDSYKKDSTILLNNTYFEDKINIPFPFKQNFGYTETIIRTVGENKINNYDKSMVGEEPSRLYSYVINPDPITKVTKEGLYIFRRECVGEDANKDDETFMSDTLIRYYTIVVSHEGIINVLGESKIGEDISFDFPSYDGEPPLKYSANQIESSIDNEIYNLFTTNKLPLTFNIPRDKYNIDKTINALKLSLGTEFTPEQQKIIENAKAFNQTMFGLKLSIDYYTSKSSRPIVSKNEILDVENKIYLKHPDSENSNDNINTKERYTKNNFNKNGLYRILIEDSTGVTIQKVDIPSKKEMFDFEIEHSSPKGLYSKVNTLNANNKVVINEKQNFDTKDRNSYFTSTNSDEIYFTFNDKGEIGGSHSINEFKAEINPNNFSINVGENILLNITNHNDLESAITKGFVTKICYDKNSQIIQDPITNVDDIVATDYTINILGNNKSEENINFLLKPNNNNSTLSVKLNYKGNPEDYQIEDIESTEPGKIIDNFSKTFILTRDKTAPSKNLEELKKESNDKLFAKTNSIDHSNFKNYYFAVSNATFENNGVLEKSPAYFNFIRNKNDYNESDELFFRRIKDINNYKESVIKENLSEEDLNKLEGGTPIFFDGNQDYIKLTYSPFIQEGETSKDYKKDYVDLSSLESGYYEVIERDEAHNYNIYRINYINNDLQCYVPQINATYNSIGSGNLNTIKIAPENLSDVAFSDKNYEVDILGKNFKIDEIIYNNLEIQTEDDSFGFLPDIAQYITISIYDGITHSKENIFPYNLFYKGIATHEEGIKEYVKDINLFIKNKTQVPNDNGYLVTIEFYNRFLNNYVVNYLVPGKPLEPIINIDKNNNIIKVEIPGKVGIGEITTVQEFTVLKYDNGVWKALETDDTNKNIINNAKLANKESLAGDTYQFGVGEYQFTIVDNFGISTTISTGVGVNNVFKFEDLFNNKQPEKFKTTYTANDFKIVYEPGYYSLKVQLHVKNDDGTYTKVAIDPNKTPELVKEIKFYEETTLKCYQFTNPYPRENVIYTISSIYERNTQYEETPYTINIYHTLPQLNLYSLSDVKLETSTNPTQPSMLTHPFKIKWKNDLFNQKVMLTKTILNEWNESVSTTYEYNTNDVIDEPGDYVATITNELGYTHSSYNIYFKYLEEKVDLYSIVAVDNGRDVFKLKRAKNNGSFVDAVTRQEYPLIVYYATTDYLQDPSSGQQDNGKTIEIRLNETQHIHYEIAKSANAEDNNNPKFQFFKISSNAENVNFHYLQYIKIEYIEPSTNFANPTFAEINNNEEMPFEIDSSTSSIKTLSETLKISWKMANMPEDEPSVTSSAFSPTKPYNAVNITVLYTTPNGNVINVKPKVYYNEKAQIAYIKLSKSGKYTIQFYDLAGNYQIISNNSKNLNVTILNSVLFSVKNDENGIEEDPIQNRFYNGDVIIKIIKDSSLYYSEPTCKATKNNSEYKLQLVNNKLQEYIFTEQGYYEFTITINVNINDQAQELVTVYKFTIINPNQSNLCLNIPDNYGFRVESIVKNESDDLTYELDNRNHLWISPNDLGTGNYEIKLSYTDSDNGLFKTFTFKAWIDNKTPVLACSIPFGSKTTSKITISFNPQVIYSQIGESYIKISGKQDFAITKDSPNKIQTITLTSNREYWLRITTKDGSIVNSYKVLKVEPLNTTAIIIIVVVVIVVVILTIVFIVLRKHFKFK